MMGIKIELCRILVAFILFGPAIALASTVGIELEEDSINRVVIAQADTSEIGGAEPENNQEEEEEPDCE